MDQSQFSSVFTHSSLIHAGAVKHYILYASWGNRCIHTFSTSHTASRCDWLMLTGFCTHSRPLRYRIAFQSARDSRISEVWSVLFVLLKPFKLQFS